MTWPSTALLLAAAAAALAVVPAVAGGDAHAMPGDQGSIVKRDHSEVKVFHPNGTFAFKFGLGVSDPRGLAVGPDGRIVVAGSNRIHMFHPNGTPALAWPHATDGGWPDYVLGVAVGPDGRIVTVGSGTHSINVFHPNGTPALAFGRHADGARYSAVPSGVAVGPDGRIVVADTGTHSIKVFHPNGTPALAFGSYGDGERQFNGPSGVAVGPDGRIVVADTGNGRIQVFQPNGTFALAFGLHESCPLSCIAVGPDGRIVVATRSSINVFHPNGTLALGFAAPASRFGYTDTSFAVAAGPAPPAPPPPPPDHLPPLDDPCPPPAPAPPGGLRPGMIVVADYEGYPASNASGRVKVFHPNGTFAFAFGQFDFIWSRNGFAVGPDGRIVVAEGNNHRVQVFHPNGTFACAFGQPRGHDERTGQRLPPGDGQFTYTQSAAVGPDGRIVVGNSHGPSQVFHPNGTFAFTLENTNSVGAVAVGPDGRIVAIMYGRDIVAFHPNGTIDRDFGLYGYFNHRAQLDQPDVSRWLSAPRDVAVGPDGRIVVAEVRARIHVFHPNGTNALTFGSLGTGPGQFNLTAGYGGMTVAVGPDGRIVAGDSGGNRIHVFHPNGTLALTFGPRGGGGMGFDNLRDVAVAPRAPPPANATVPPPPANATVPPPPAPVTVVVEPGAPVGPLNFTDAGDAANLTIDVAGLAGPAGPLLNGSESSTVTFPASETTIAASFATVSFPPNVTAAHVPAGGLLALHVSADVPNDARVQGALAYDGSGRVELQRVVEVGGASGRVVFDLPVRILLEGQAGGRAFYIEGDADGGKITPIDAACAADDVARVHRHLGGAGECQMDSADGDKIIYTYHLTKFGTALPERAAPPPVIHTCSVGLGAPDLGMSARPGEQSAPVLQTVINSGSAPFARVDLAATAWNAGPPQGADAPAPLPASATEVGTEGAGGPYVPLANGTAVAHGLGGGQEEGLWFRLNMDSYEDARPGTLVQEVTYQAMCRMP